MGARVVLSDPAPADEAAVLAVIAESRAFLRGRASGPSTRDQYTRYLQRCARPDFHGWLIRRRADGAVVGLIELSQIVLGSFRSAYLGYLIGAEHARQGYMTEAITLALRRAFGELGLHRVEANIQPTNHASLGLVAKLGFVREGYSRRYLKIAGRWRDHERWAVLAEDWPPRGRGRTARGISLSGSNPRTRRSTRAGSSPASSSSARPRARRTGRRRS